MVWPFVALLAAFLVETHSHQPFKVFEIRKARDPDRVIDYQYYDPDLTRVQSAIHRKRDKERLLKLADDIAKRFHMLPQYEENYASSDSDSSFVDETRSAVIVIPSQDVVYKARPAKENILQKLIQSALRAGNDVEDRTAAPMHRNPYDYDD